MTFSIDTGMQTEWSAKSAVVDETQDVRFTNWTRADRTKRQIIEQIEALETPQDVENYMTAESIMLDALHLFDPAMAEDITNAAEDQKAFTAPRPAVPGVPETIAQQGKPMFSIDTNTGGAKGPFLNYKQRAGQGMGDGTWYLREKDGEEWSYTDMTEAFKGGFVADIFATHDGQLGGTLQLGFIRFYEGKAPDRHIWASPLKSEPRRNEDKSAQGGYEWQNLVNFRIAIGGGKDALFDVSGWGGYKGVMAAIEAMNKSFAPNVGKCPVLQYTGFRTEGSGAKRMNVPEFVIGSWVDRPACLKAETPQIAATAPAPQQAPKPAPAPAAAVSETAF